MTDYYRKYRNQFIRLAYLLMAISLTPNFSCVTMSEKKDVKNDIFTSNIQSEGKSYRIAVLDFEKFKNQSKVFQKSTASLMNKYKMLKKKLDKEVSITLQLEEELKNQNEPLRQETEERKRKQLKEKRQHVEYLRKDYTQQMKDADLEASKKMVNELTKIVGKIARAEGYDLIIQKKISLYEIVNEKSVGVIYCKPSILPLNLNKIRDHDPKDIVDITGQVIETHDKSKKL